MTFKRNQFETVLYQLPWNEPPPSISLHYFETLASTNAKLWELLDRGMAIPAIAIAAQQTAGRGQWGRQWQSPPGGLYLSIALAPQIPVSYSFHLTLYSAWGIATLLRQHQVPVGLKWPNDLILEGRKLGGLKIETRIQKSAIVQAVIGVGINWHNSVPERGTNLQSFPTVTSLEMLAAIAVGGILKGYQQYRRDGIETILASYNCLLCSRGRAVIVDGCPGVVVAVEATGALRIRLESDGIEGETCRMPGTISLGYDP